MSRRFLAACDWYVRRYLARHFHKVSVSLAGTQTVPVDTPLIVYGNHAAWWDPLLGLLLVREVFPERTLYAPIDAKALKNYRILERLGLFGVEQASRRGAAQFLRQADAILATPGASLWLTPEGRFVDPRDTSSAFEPGLAHLARRMERGVLIPIAAEYVFWEERLPEALVRIGHPVDVSSHPAAGKEEWQRLLRYRLRVVQEELREASIARRTDDFEVLVRGNLGVGGIYDWIRRARAILSGRRFSPQHSTKLQ